ncbi:MAG: group 1 truncated hemoglobin [Gammaproteobacteria bacterium]|nr:group 1 truncated hemoglobin [Gammaproteobacteria bacterium]
MAIDKTLFDRIGGMPTLERVHKIFYDKLFAHPWLKQFFVEHPQEIFEKQQTTFMAGLMGGPKVYAGKTPKMAHQNILITDEMFELRSSILSQSISEANIADDLRDEWLEADRTLKQAVVKSSIDECRTMFDGQRIYDIPRP